MNIEDINDVLEVSGVLASHGLSDAAHTPSLIADLIDWSNNRVDAAVSATEYATTGVDTTLPKIPKAKPAKATESDDSVPTTTPDPSEPDF